MKPHVTAVNGTIARVALDLPVPTLFDYRAPGVSVNDIGKRVLVPLGKKVALGVIMELVAETHLPAAQLRSVISVLHEIPALPEDLLALFRFTSNYYHYPIGQVVVGTLPARLRRGGSSKIDKPAYYRLTADGSAADAAALAPRAKVQREVLRQLHGSDAALSEGALNAIASTAKNALKALLARGLIERVAPPVTSIAVADIPESALTLNSEQLAALATIRGTRAGFQPWLLHGVTGSGKTEVYLELVKDTINAGKQALLLVPEINLTPQLESVVRQRFPGATLASLHSGLNEGERLRGWIAAQSGEANIVLGTRLAAFTPMPQLGLIVVDEEHDTSFKQMDGLRYSARDLAVVRAKQRGIPVILGSATPALETLQSALSGRYHKLALTQPVNALFSAIECVDTRKDALIDGLSQPLLRAIETSLAGGEQTLIFINRRGYAPVLRCSSCGWISECARCSAKLVVHLADGLRCHHCGHHEQLPSACPQCGNHGLAPLGQGTQRIESALARTFPSARILRIDRDTTRPKLAWPEMRRQINNREVDILVGTQILSKGHDFPQLNLVGVINADSSLYSSDFRAGERLFARLTQVAGRAGRGRTRGRVMIQTEFPGHPLYEALIQGDYMAYAGKLLDERKQAGFPPFVHQALLHAEAHKLAHALAFLGRAIEWAGAPATEVTVYDPVPARMTRRAGLERAQLTIQASSRAALHDFLGPWLERLRAARERSVRWWIDVDPLEV